MLDTCMIWLGNLPRTASAMAALVFLNCAHRQPVLEELNPNTWVAGGTTSIKKPRSSLIGWGDTPKKKCKIHWLIRYPTIFRHLNTLWGLRNVFFLGSLYSKQERLQSCDARVCCVPSISWEAEALRSPLPAGPSRTASSGFPWSRAMNGLYTCIYLDEL
jgi:hypothetical protein